MSRQQPPGWWAAMLRPRVTVTHRTLTEHEGEPPTMCTTLRAVRPGDTQFAVSLEFAPGTYDPCITFEQPGAPCNGDVVVLTPARLGWVAELALPALWSAAKRLKLNAGAPARRTKRTTPAAVARRKLRLC